MGSYFRRLLRAVWPEGIPAPGAAVYDALSRSGVFQRHYELVARDILDYCRDGRLLDIGTGPGWLLLKLHRQGARLQLAGVDISPAMVRRAWKNLAQVGLGSDIEVLEASAAGLPFPDAAFDIVVSTGSFHHWRDPVGGLNECYRVLKDGGSALVYDLVPHLPEEVARAARQQFGRYRMWLLWLHSFEEPFRSPQELADLAAASGFGAGETKFVGVLCCLVLRKPPVR